MKHLIIILLLLSHIHGHTEEKNQDKLIQEFYQKLHQHRLTKGFQYKGPASLAIRKLLHEADAEKLGITRVRFDHIIPPKSSQQESDGFAQKEPKPQEIEFQFTSGAPASHIMDMITRKCGWHIAEIKDGILVINARHKPDIEEAPEN